MRITFENGKLIFDLEGKGKFRSENMPQFPWVVEGIEVENAKEEDTV